MAAELQAIRFNCATARSELDKGGPDARDYARVRARYRVRERKLQVTSQKEKSRRLNLARLAFNL